MTDVSDQTKFQESRHETPLCAVEQGNTDGPHPHMPPQPDDELPSNIHDASQLDVVPKECLSGNDQRPLLHKDDLGNEFLYALQPMSYSVRFILIVELLERFSFYGYYYTLTLYLTGAYNEDWNAGFTSVKASSFVSMSTMVAYTTPFVGAYLADSVWGDYRSIIFGLLVFYVPGVFLMTLTTIPDLLGDEFNESLLTLSLLVLWPMGTGIVKSIVNVFGAKQFHPFLQSSMIESYYVNFYMSINIGALIGIGTIPILAQYNVALAYSIPFGLLLAGVVVFLSGASRYVQSPPRGELFGTAARSKKKGRRGGAPNKHAANTIPLSAIFRICLLIVPFCVGYNQMPTTFIVQGNVMTKAFGIIDVASMNSLDAISVLLFGYVTASYIYPALAKRNIKVPTTTKFAIGSGLGALAICWALVVEHMIHQAYYERDGSQICVLWQAPSYILIGWGEIFAVSAAYEVAFTASSPDKKALASATNIFCVGGLPNLLCIVLYHTCSTWFQNSRGTTEIAHIEDYATAHVRNYFYVLLGVMLLGVLVNSLPSVRNFVTSVEDRAVDLVKTPVVMRRRGKATSADYDDETTALLTPGARRYKEYLEHGSGPVLYKMGSMRAGPSLSQSDLPGAKPKKIKYKYVPKLYNASSLSEGGVSKVAIGPDGLPIKVGQQINTPTRKKNKPRAAEYDRLNST